MSRAVRPSTPEVPMDGLEILERQLRAERLSQGRCGELDASPG
ncbi:MAG: hypothetical protein AAGA68_15110 [Pseudomonadota bacterium]